MDFHQSNKDTSSFVVSFSRSNVYKGAMDMVVGMAVDNLEYMVHSMFDA